MYDKYSAQEVNVYATNALYTVCKFSSTTISSVYTSIPHIYIYIYLYFKGNILLQSMFYVSKD